MRKLLWAFFISTPLVAQVSNPSIISVAVAPSGACSAGLPNQQVVTTGVQYSCQNGTWGAIAGGSGTVNAGTTGQISYYPGNAAAVSGTSTPTSTFLDTGGAVFNVKAYGAKGDGSTNDCSAITSAEAARTSAGGGTLFFPTGQYVVGTACHLSITANGRLMGVGSCGNKGVTSTMAAACPAAIISTDTTGNLFTVTADNFLFDTIGIFNTATATAGAGVLVDGSTNSLEKVSFEKVAIAGFYDDIDHYVGALWTVHDSILLNPVRYAISISNDIVQDNGDWTIEGSSIQCQTNTALACIYISGSGGGKIIGNQIIGNPSAPGSQYGIEVNCTACTTNQLYVVGNAVTEFTDAAFYAPNGFQQIVLSANQFGVQGTTSAVVCNNCGGFFLGGGTLFTNSPGVPVTVSGSSSGIILPSGRTGNTTANSVVSGVYDYSSMNQGKLTMLSGGSTSTGQITAKDNSNGCATYMLDDGNGHLGAIAACYSANKGLRFIPIRDSSAGFEWDNNAGTSQMALDTTNATLKPQNLSMTGTFNDTVTGAANTPLFKSTTSHAQPEIDKGSLGSNAVTIYMDQGVLKWDTGLEGDDNLDFYDRGASRIAAAFVTGALGTGYFKVNTVETHASQTAIASAATIAPITQFFHVSGTTAIDTITAPTGCTIANFMCLITIIPDGLFTTTTAGNIALASTAVVSKALIMTYDPATSKWYPSY